jgi:hypothetical protein
LIGDASQQPRVRDLRAKLIAWLKDNHDPIVAR